MSKNVSKLPVLFLYQPRRMTVQDWPFSLSVLIEIMFLNNKCGHLGKFFTFRYLLVNCGTVVHLHFLGLLCRCTGVFHRSWSSNFQISYDLAIVAGKIDKSEIGHGQYLVFNIIFLYTKFEFYILFHVQFHFH